MRHHSSTRPGGTSRINIEDRNLSPLSHSPVRVGIMLRTLLCAILMIAASGCHRETTDIAIPEGADVITLEGRVIDYDGNPVGNVKVECYYQKAIPCFRLTRLKAETLTDRDGRYSLRLYQRKTEQGPGGISEYFEILVDRENQDSVPFSSWLIYSPEVLSGLRHDYLGDYILYEWKDTDIRASAPPEGCNKLFVYIQAPDNMYPLWEGQGKTIKYLLSCEGYSETLSAIKHRLPIGPKLEIWGLWCDTLDWRKEPLPTDTAYFSVMKDRSLKIVVGADGSITME